MHTAKLTATQKSNAFQKHRFNHIWPALRKVLNFCSLCNVTSIANLHVTIPC